MLILSKDIRQEMASGKADSTYKGPRAGRGRLGFVQRPWSSF